MATETPEQRLRRVHRALIPPNVQRLLDLAIQMPIPARDMLLIGRTPDEVIQDVRRHQSIESLHRWLMHEASPQDLTHIHAPFRMVFELPGDGVSRAPWPADDIGLVVELVALVNSPGWDALIEQLHEREGR